MNRSIALAVAAAALAMATPAASARLLDLSPTASQPVISAWSAAFAPADDAAWRGDAGPRSFALDDAVGPYRAAFALEDTGRPVRAGFVPAGPAVTLASALAGTVPEAPIWAPVMLGFGAMGFVLRRRRPASARIRFA